MRVALFVTGDMEQAALADALGRLFPDHSFECVPKTPPAGPFTSFTSSRLPIEREVSRGVRTVIDELIQRAQWRLLNRRGQGAEPPDLLVIVDDLELANLDQPGVVVDSFRGAVRAHLDQLGASRKRVARAFRDKVSLHFAVPMIESWIFADPAGPERVGMPAAHALAALPCHPTFEDFLTDDPAYLADDCRWCTDWYGLSDRQRAKRSTRKARQPEWCRGEAGERPRHPKRYLAWLCRDATTKKCSSYRETGGERCGAAALRELDWPALLHVGQMPFLHALLDDLAEGLGEASPLAADAPLAEETRRKSRGAVLRNL